MEVENRKGVKLAEKLDTQSEAYESQTRMVEAVVAREMARERLEDAEQVLRELKKKPRTKD